MAAHARSLLAQQATLEVVVLHTTVAETLTALKTAARLADGLSAHIRLLVIQAVPYPLPLDRPSVALPFTQRRFRTLADHVAIETNVDIHLVRDRKNAIDALLEPHSVVVLGTRRRWWRNGIARRLTRAGHQVVHA